MHEKLSFLKSLFQWERTEWTLPNIQMLIFAFREIINDYNCCVYDESGDIAML